MIRNTLIAGATGLTGNELVSLLLKSDYYNSVHILSRRPYNSESIKLFPHLVDFENLKNFNPETAIHDVYICLGTTIKKAGNKENFLKVDSDYVLEVARWAKQNRVERLAFISSMGAYAKSKNFYLSAKGKVEKELEKFQIPHLVILRPSILLGKRSEFRMSESIGKVVMILLKPFLFGRMKRISGVSARLVAFAMHYHTIQTESPLLYLENEQILKLSGNLK
jgi:uncharacterized protein YbjT (DUF2867 family)